MTPILKIALAQNGKCVTLIILPVWSSYSNVGLLCCMFTNNHFQWQSRRYYVLHRIHQQPLAMAVKKALCTTQNTPTTTCNGSQEGTMYYTEYTNNHLQWQSRRHYVLHRIHQQPLAMAVKKALCTTQNTPTTTCNGSQEGTMYYTEYTNNHLQWQSRRHYVLHRIHQQPLAMAVKKALCTTQNTPTTTFNGSQEGTMYYTEYTNNHLQWQSRRHYVLHRIHQQPLAMAVKKALCTTQNTPTTTCNGSQEGTMYYTEYTNNHLQWQSRRHYVLHRIHQQPLAMAVKKALCTTQNTPTTTCNGSQEGTMYYTEYTNNHLQWQSRRHYVLHRIHQQPLAMTVKKALCTTQNTPTTTCNGSQEGTMYYTEYTNNHLRWQSRRYYVLHRIHQQPLAMAVKKALCTTQNTPTTTFNGSQEGTMYYTE